MRINALKYSYGIGRTETRGNAVLGCDFFGFVFGGCPDATEEDAGEGLAERAAQACGSAAEDAVEHDAPGAMGSPLMCFSE